MARTIEATIEQIGRSTAETNIRDHQLLIDRPEAKGGADRGPMGGELLLAALGGCFMSNLLAAVRARDAAVSDASVTVTATLDGTPERMTHFTLTVSARCDDEELLAHLAKISERGCLVANTLAAGSTIELIVKAHAAAGS